LLRFSSSKTLLIQEDLWISNFSIAGGWYYLALAMSQLAITDAAGSKNAQRCYTSRSYFSRRTEKYTNLYIKRAKIMCSGKWKTQDLELGEEYTALR
jgi:hypothetical protein